MPGINGLELAQKIRLKYLKPYLVFITSHMEYSVEGYEYNAYRYILKENMEEKLPPALEIMLEDLKTTLIVRSGGQIKFDTQAKEAIYYVSIYFGILRSALEIVFMILGIIYFIKYIKKK